MQSAAVTHSTETHALPWQAPVVRAASYVPSVISEAGPSFGFGRQIISTVNLSP